MVQHRRRKQRRRSFESAASLALLLSFLFASNPRALCDGGVDTKAEPRCEDVSKLPASDDACAFAKLHCDTGSLVPYPELYYCLAKPAGAPAAALAALLATAALVALFRALSATAEDYFTPALTRAAAAARMPPRLAGATLLALGNGAPDIGAAVAAARGGALELAAGALLGSGLFVGCVVAGAVVRAAGGVPARGALLRDVCGYGIAVLGAVLVLSRGGGSGGGKAGKGDGGGETTTTAGFGSAAFLLLLYLCYVLAVAGADAARILKDARGFDEGEEAEEEEARDRNGGGVGSGAPLLAPPSSAFSWAPPEADLPLAAAPAASLSLGHHHNQGGLSPPSHLSAAAAEELEMTLSDMTTTTGGGFGNGGGGGRSPPRSARTTVSDWRASSFGGGNGEAGSFSDDDENSKEGSRALASATASSHDQLQPRGDLFAASGSPPLAPDTEPRRTPRAMGALPLFFLGGGGGEAADEPSLSSRFSACLRFLDAPFTVSRAMTIPVLPGDGGDGEEEPVGASKWLPVALLLGPPAAALRLSPWSPSSSPLRFGISLVLGAVSGGVASVACLIARGRDGGGGEGANGGEEDEEERSQQQHSSSSLLLFVPSPSRRLRKLALTSVRAFSLLAAALWVDALASELVGAATLVGAVSGAPPALVGGTLLAWGNSAGDLVTNVAVAKRGLPNMALTACFASPLANLLLGLGVGIALAAAGGSPVRLPSGGLSKEIASAAAWVGAMVSTVVLIALLGKRRLPPAASWALLGVYLCYVASGLASAAAGGG